MQTPATAVIAPYAPGRFFALPPVCSVAVLDEFTPIEVPAAPYYCNSLLRWQQQLLPVLDLASLIRALPAAQIGRRYVLVAAYQAREFAPIQHGALMIADLPQMIAVTDADASALPDDSDIWPEISVSCFRHADQPVPILDPALLFARQLS